VGKSYVYEVVDSEGGTSDRPDPYAREMMGEQRGLSRMYLDAKTGKEVNRYAGESVELMRFDVDDEEDAHSAYLVLKDASGRQLSRDELLARLGTSTPRWWTSCTTGSSTTCGRRTWKRTGASG